MKHVIEAVDTAGDCLSYRLPESVTPEQIESVLGFAPNVQDDPDKVTMSWGFKLDGVRCGIWDYKGYRWSVFDPTGHKVSQLFQVK